MKAEEIEVVVIGTPEHEGRMLGRALGRLGVTPTYIDPGRPVLPTTPAPDVVLLSREWSIDLRHAAAQARQNGIPVIYLMDGVIEWAYLWDNWGYVKPEGTVLQPLIASDLCVIGRHPARILAALGLADRIHVVGMPRLDGFQRRRILDHDAPPRIVVASAKTFGHNVAHQVYVRAALRDLKCWCDQHSEIQPIWRIDARLAEELEISQSLERSLIEDLQGARGVISFTSSVILEAMLIGVPTAQIDYRTVPQYVQTAWEIRAADHIEAVIRELIYPPPEKIAFQESCLMDELELGDASERLANVIRQIASGEPITEVEARVADRGLLDFRQVHSHLSAFTVSPMSRLQYELDATYKLWERDREHLAKHSAEITRMAHLRGALDELRIDPLAILIQRLAWMPGFRRTARLIGSITGRSK